MGQGLGRGGLLEAGRGVSPCNSRWVLICLGTISKAASLISDAGLRRLRLGEWAGRLELPGISVSLCRLSSMSSSGAGLLKSDWGLLRCVCPELWAAASHIVPAVPFYWVAVTKDGQVPGKGSWTPPLRGEKPGHLVEEQGVSGNTVAPRWLLGNLHPRKAV